MINRKKGLTTASLTLAAASLVSVAFVSQASAQCAECAQYPNRNPFTQGLVTKTQPHATVASPPQATKDAHAEMRAPHGSHHMAVPDPRRR
jgi:hypothetical protein